MLIITVETSAAAPAGTECLARACGYGNRLIGGVSSKAIVDDTRGTVRTDSRSATLRVEGAFRSPVDRVLRSRVEALMHDGVRFVVLDLSAVPTIDAAGVGELIQILTAAAAAGGAVAITQANPHVRQVLEVAGVLALVGDWR
jgi:RNA polymerase sigma-B factor